MQNYATPDLQNSGTTRDREETKDCACTPLMACWACYHAGDRGRPATRRVN